MDFLYYLLGFENQCDIVQASDRQAHLKHLAMKQIKLSTFRLKSIDTPPDDLYNGLKPLKLTRQTRVRPEKKKSNKKKPRMEWLKHVSKYQKEHPGSSWGESLKGAKSSYKKVSSEKKK